MTMEWTVEQRDIMDAVRRALSDAADGDSWSALTTMGCTEIGVPEQYGGAGGTLKDLCAVALELGRALDPGPFFASAVLAGLLLSELAPAPDDQMGITLARLATGSTRVAVAGNHGARDGVVWSDDDEGVVLSGHTHFVMDGMDADTVLVIATSDKGRLVATVDAIDNGVERTAMTTLDLTRPMASVTFDGVRPTEWVPVEGTGAVDRATAAMWTVLAAEQVGSARACLDMSVAYAKTRKQFGRPIGSFQAIKHRLVDMSIAVELAEAAVLDAANAAVDRDEASMFTAVSIARVLASRAASFAAEESIQVHGGIGFTWEHPLHHYFRRAKSAEMLFGSMDFHLDRIAEAVLEQA
jgi:alkylation response protein AidB-like acyl-CoA dehydrogenase